MSVVFIFFANVPDEVSLLASGAQPAQAGCGTEVPQAWVFGPSARVILLCHTPQVQYLEPHQE